jgi:hypothetical protein
MDITDAVALFHGINQDVVLKAQEKGPKFAVACMRDFMSFISRANEPRFGDQQNSNNISAAICSGNHLDVSLRPNPGVPLEGVLHGDLGGSTANGISQQSNAATAK